MGKKEFFDILMSLKPIEENANEECQNLVEFGITATFQCFTEEEIKTASKYLRRWPHIYYNQYIRCVLDVDPLKKIKNCSEETRKVIWEYHRYFYHQFVGPFFYVDGQILGVKTNISEGNINDDFINSPVSHFDCFKFLGIEGDYGNYPRGRVIYNNKTNEFYLYIDKEYKNNQEVIDMVMIRYHLSGYNTVIKTDSHYTHDYL